MPLAENGRKRQAQFDYAADHWGGNRGASTFGSRLAESAYEACLAYERRQGEYGVERQKPLPVVSTDVKPYGGCRLDLVVEDKVIVEVQAIERLTRSMMPNCFPIFVLGARA
jgi:hypothetical protein